MSELAELRRGATVVKAWAPWCGSCRAMKPVVDEIAEGHNVSVVDVRVDDAPDLVSRFRLRSVPTLIALRDGTEVGRLVGAQSPEAIARLFDAAEGKIAAVPRVKPPAAITAARATAGAVIVASGWALSTPVLVVVGAALALWAVFGATGR